MKIRLRLNIGLVGERKEIMEIDDDELEGLDETQREKYLDQVAEDWANNFIDLSWSEVDE